MPNAGERSERVHSRYVRWASDQTLGRAKLDLLRKRVILG
jgi:hypothetical protein